jgi:hypothetical protein
MLSTFTQAASLVIVGRRRTMDWLGLSTATDGTNTDLAAVLARTVRLLGGQTADPMAPTDDEIATVTADSGDDRFIAAADLQLIEYILGNWTEVTYSLDGRSEQLGQLRDGLVKDLDRLTAAYAARYGADPGTAGAVAGVRGGRLCPAPWAGRPGYGWRGGYGGHGGYRGY